MAAKPDDMDAAFEREVTRHIESYRPGNGEMPDIEVRGYDDPTEGQMTVLTFGFNTVALAIHINRDWLHYLEAMIEGVEHERRVARGMEIVKRVIERANEPKADEP
jgi:hypothetical protein